MVLVTNDIYTIIVKATIPVLAKSDYRESLTFTQGY